MDGWKAIEIKGLLKIEGPFHCHQSNGWFIPQLTQFLSLLTSWTFLLQLSRALTANCKMKISQRGDFSFPQILACYCERGGEN